MQCCLSRKVIIDHTRCLRSSACYHIYSVNEKKNGWALKILFFFFFTKLPHVQSDENVNLSNNLQDYKRPYFDRNPFPCRSLNLEVQFISLSNLSSAACTFSFDWNTREPSAYLCFLTVCKFDFIRSLRWYDAWGRKPLYELNTFCVLITTESGAKIWPIKSI